MWTSYAHVATHMFTLVRTSVEERKQAGISLLLIDMESPGISVRPIATLDGKHHVNEVFLDDVRVPVTDLLGEEGMGWSYGKVLLDRERGVGAANALRLSQQLRAVREAARRTTIGGKPLLQQSSFRGRLAQVEIEAIAIENMVMRLMADAAAGKDSGPRASMLKLRWSELLQQALELWTEALGPDASSFGEIEGVSADLPADMPYAMQGALYSRVTTIYGGSSEIQRNIVARRLLGL
jgi:alkylation response protein AidB-like acyl-CoA dehydrogenase